MAGQYENMYQENYYHPNRSPGSTRGNNGNGLTLNRQASRHFGDNTSNYSVGGSQLQSMYAASDYHLPHDDPPRFDRVSNVGSNTVHANYGYENQTWNTYGGQNGMAMMGATTGRAKPMSARRPGLPNGWMDQPQQAMPHNANLSSYQLNSQYNMQPNFGSRALQQESDRDEELIPTAIVIKNIPFAVKKEQLTQLMTEMMMPLPYAFNYHFDQGVFRGLAFANFTTPEETKQVIDAMNHLELQGRKLRVEYKKMLPAQERDRIEREKREKRGQLQEQHQPITVGQVQHPLHPVSSMNSLSSNHHATSPSPVSIHGRGGHLDYDLNDPMTLSFYNQIILFKNNKEQDVLEFSPAIPPAERKVIHTLAHHMELYHTSENLPDGQRRLVIHKKKMVAPISPPISQLPLSYYQESRRSLNRAATIDFAEARERDNANYHAHTLRNQGSGLLDIPGPQSPGLNGLAHGGNLRAAKSFADLRSYTPSPAPSAASFPAGLSQNISRYTDYGHGSVTSGTPNLTPTSAGGGTMSTRDESFLVNGLQSLGLPPSSQYERQSRITGRLGQERDTHNSNAGPIGSQRPVNGNSAYDDAPRNGIAAERQPRGPPADWSAGSGFSRPRQNGHVNRGSGELDLSGFDNSWDDNRADSSDRTGASHTTSRYN